MFCLFCPFRPTKTTLFLCCSVGRPDQLFVWSFVFPLTSVCHFCPFPPFVCSFAAFCIFSSCHCFRARRLFCNRDELVTLFFEEPFMQAIQTNCPWLLRYLVTAIILTKVSYRSCKPVVVVVAAFFFFTIGRGVTWLDSTATTLLADGLCHISGSSSSIHHHK